LSETLRAILAEQLTILGLNQEIPRQQGSAVLTFHQLFFWKFVAHNPFKSVYEYSQFPDTFHPQCIQDVSVSRP